MGAMKQGGLVDSEMLSATKQGVNRWWETVCKRLRSALFKVSS